MDDIGHLILHHLPSPDDVASLRLVSRTFASIGQKQQFSRVSLGTMTHAKSLHTLFIVNTALLSSVSELRLGQLGGSQYGVRHMDNDDWDPLWKWLCTPLGLHMLQGFCRLQSLIVNGMTWRATSTFDEAREPKFHVFKTLVSSSVTIRRISIDGSCFFTTPSAVCFFTAIFDGVQSLTLGNFDYPWADWQQWAHEVAVPNAECTRQLSGRYSNLQSLTIQFDAAVRDREVVLRRHVDIGAFDQLTSITLLDIYSDSLDEMANLLNHVASTIKHIVIGPLTGHVSGTEWAPAISIKQIPHLETLTFKRYDIYNFTYLALIFKSALPTHRLIKTLNLEPSVRCSNLRKARMMIATSKMDELALHAEEVQLETELRGSGKRVRKGSQKDPQKWRSWVSQQLLPQKFSRGGVERVMISFPDFPA